MSLYYYPGPVVHLPLVQYFLFLLLRNKLNSSIYMSKGGTQASGFASESNDSREASLQGNFYYIMYITFVIYPLSFPSQSHTLSWLFSATLTKKTRQVFVSMPYENKSEGYFSYIFA